MRIISGKYRGAKLYSPEDNRVRPTTDRIKESVFNIICSRLNVCGATVLDLFSGSGALGLEAYSRGAKKVVFIDNDKDSIRLTKSNIAKLRVPTENYEIYQTEYFIALKKLENRRFDIVFADPPYASGYFDNILEHVKKYNILNESGIMVVEHDSKTVVENEDYFVDCRKMGNTAVSFLTRRDR